MTAPDMTAILERSDERDRYSQRILDAWRDGFAAGERAHADDYEAGFADGATALKNAQHDAHRLAELEARRWSLRGEPRTPQSFAQPHPADYQGGPLPLERPGEVWLGGPAVHHHRPCTQACRSYRPGWYSAADAIAILRRLPGDYASQIAALRTQAPAGQGGEAA